jgi:hypothetical protein
MIGGGVANDDARLLLEPDERTLQLRLVRPCPEPDDVDCVAPKWLLSPLGIARAARTGGGGHKNGECRANRASRPHAYASERYSTISETSHPSWFPTDDDDPVPMR